MKKALIYLQWQHRNSCVDIAVYIFAPIPPTDLLKKKIDLHWSLKCVSLFMQLDFAPKLQHSLYVRSRLIIIIPIVIIRTYSFFFIISRWSFYESLSHSLSHFAPPLPPFLNPSLSHPSLLCLVVSTWWIVSKWRMLWVPYFERFYLQRGANWRCFSLRCICSPGFFPPSLLLSISHHLCHNINVFLSLPPFSARCQAVQAENVTVLEGGTAQIFCRLHNYDGSIVVIQNPRRQTLFFNGTRGASQCVQAVPFQERLFAAHICRTEFFFFSF